MLEPAPTSAPDDLGSLRLQLEWGIDEAILDAPIDRFALPPVRADTRPAPPLARLPAAGPVRALATAPGLAAEAAAAANTLAELQAVIAGFDACPLRMTASTTVAPSGNPAAGLVVIGDAPGPDDDRSGQAYSGILGDAVDRVLASAGLSRERLLLTHLVPWRPPGGRPLNDGEIATCLPFLYRLLALARPRRIVVLGGVVLKALTPDTPGVRRPRGRWTDLAVPGPLPALPMLAASQWLGSPADKEATWRHMLTLRETLDLKQDRNQTLEAETC